jgi:hypothetical protein
VTGGWGKLHNEELRRGNITCKKAFKIKKAVIN